VDAAFITTKDGRWVDFNEAAVDLFGYNSREQLQQVPIEDLYVDPADREAHIRTIQRQGFAKGYPIDLQKRDGSVIQALVTSVAVEDEEGAVIGFQGTIRDVTELQRSKQTLRRLQEETAHSHRLLLALSQAAEAVQRARTPDEVYETVGHKVTGLGYEVIVFRLTEDRQHLNLDYVTLRPKLLRAAEKLTGLSAQTYRLPLSRAPIFSRLLSEGGASFNDPTADFMAGGLPEPLQPLARRLASLVGLEQSITASLMVDDEAYGLLMVSGTDLKEVDVPAVLAFANQTAIALENAKKEEALRRRAEELASLQANVLDITARRDLPTLLHTIVERAAHLLDAPRGGMYLSNPEREEVRCVVSHNTLSDYRGTVLDYGEGAAGTVAERGKPLIIDDYRSWDRRAAVYEEEQPFTAVISAPMIWQGEVTGVINVLHDVETRRFTPDDLELLTLFANHAAIAVENARLYGEVQQHAAQLEALRRVELDITAQLDLEALLDSVVSQAIKLLDGVAGGLYVYRPDQELLEFVTAIGREGVPLGSMLRRGEGLSGKVWETGEPLIVDDYRAWSGQSSQFEGLPIVSVVGVPIRWGDEFLGVLTTEGGASCTFSRDDAELLSLFATQAAIAIRNARLYQQAQEEIAERKRAEGEVDRYVRHMEALLEIDRAISSTLDLDQVLVLVLERLQQVLPYDSASIFFLTDGTAELAAARGHPEPERVSQLSFRVENDPLTSRMLRRGRPVILDDAQADDRFRQRGSTDYVRSWIGVPLMVGGEAVGVMSVDHRDVEVYDETSAAQLQAFARQAAVAIDNARLFEQAQREIEQRKRAEDALERQLERLSLLNRVTRSMTARDDLDSILQVAVKRLEEHFSDLATVWLREGDDLTLASAGDRSRCVLDRSGLPRCLPVPSEFAGRASADGSRYVPDLTALDAPVLKPLVGHPDVRSAVVVPLMAEGSLLGVLVSGRKEPNAFNRKEIAFLEGLSKHVALAVRQAQLHQNLQAAYDDLRQSQRTMMRQERLRALGEMASGIAHDINNAISPVPLYTSLIAREADLDDQVASYLHTIETAVSDVEGTVGRMREFYREREEENLVRVALNRAVREAMELTRPRWRDVPQERGVTIHLEIDLAEDLPPVAGAEGEIRQAVTNLILNAVDAMPNGGTLALRTRAAIGPPDRVIVEVSDTGIGMDEEILSRCFEPFFSTKGERGSGMGLAMVYGTMQRHGGDVQVESAPGEGTTMRLLFPVRELVAEEGVEEPIGPLAPLRVLVVDDELLLREALQKTLEREGHTVTLADGGESGLSAFRAARQRGKPFDVVITDLGMPFVSGRQVARGVKSEAPETPVILLTGWGVRLSAERDVPADVDLMLTKPPTIPALNRALAQVTLGD